MTRVRRAPLTGQARRRTDARGARRHAHLPRVGRPAASAKRTLRAVEGVSLAVRPGEVVALVGESGCGKTTLARMLLGLLPPTAGEIRIGGEPTAGAAAPRRSRALVQPVFQDPYSSLNPRKSIGSIIALPLRVQGGTRQRHLAPRAWRR